MSGEAQVFLGTEPKEAPARKRVLEQPERVILQAAIEVDEDVAARDEVHFGKHRVGDQAVVGEHHVATQVRRCGTTFSRIALK